MRSAPRIWAAAATTIAAAIVLSACSPQPAQETDEPIDGTGKTLLVYISANPQYPEEQQEWFDDMSARFEDETGATVTFETFANASDQLTRLQTSVISGQGPDIYGLTTTFTPTAYATGAFLELGDAEWDALGGRDKFAPASLGLSGPDAEHEIGIPFVTRPYLLAYNTELLDAAGIDEPAATWDELTDQAEELTTADQYGLAVAYKDSLDPWKFIWAMANQAGNTLIDGDDATLDSPEVEAAYETYFDWVASDGVVDPASVGWANAQAVAAFADGKAAYLPLTTMATIPTFDESAVAGKYAYTLMPTVPPGYDSRPSGGSEAASILSGTNLAIADYTPNKDLALAFVKMITDEDVQTSYATMFSQIPNNQAAAEAIASDDPLIAPSLEAQKRSVATPFNGAWADVQLALTNVVVQSIPDLAAGDVSSSTLEDRLAEAQQAAQDAVDRAAGQN